MPYKALLVFADNSPQSAARIEATAELAKRFDATLIGVASALPRVLVDPSGTLAADMIASERQQIEVDLKSAAARFKSQTGKSGVKTEWRSAVAFPANAMIDAAAAADLLVVGRAEAGAVHDIYNSAGPGDVLMGAGRPLLVVPPHAKAIDPTDIVVAWKDTREARRAVSDALPLLQMAEKVVVLEFRGENNDGSLANVEAYLKRHAVKVTVQSTAHSGGKVEEDLFRFVSVAGSGLIVAGGYGHTRLREWMFGGVTRALLTESPIPVLLSH
jgi:nucleotide-binding universal stress UspA family protein